MARPEDEKDLLCTEATEASEAPVRKPTTISQSLLEGTPSSIKADLLANIEADLPENIYGASMMAAARSTQGHHPFFHGITISVYLGLFFNFLMQLYVLIFAQIYICRPAVLFVRELYETFHEASFDVTDAGLVFSEEKWTEFSEHDASDVLCQLPLSQPPFVIAILIIWTCTCFKDLQDTYVWTKVWCQLPLSESGVTHVEIDNGRLVTVSVSMKTRAAVILCVLLPKCLACCYLWWLGARWLVSTTSFAEVLLNSCGLAFLTELDELLYQVLIPPSIKDMVKIYKFTTTSQDWVQLEKQIKEQANRIANSASSPSASAVKSPAWHTPLRAEQVQMALWMVCTMGLMIAVPMGYFYFFQQVLPGYRWDVHDACEEKIRRMFTLH